MARMNSIVLIMSALVIFAIICQGYAESKFVELRNKRQVTCATNLVSCVTGAVSGASATKITDSTSYTTGAVSGLGSTSTVGDIVTAVITLLGCVTTVLGCILGSVGALCNTALAFVVGTLVTVISTLNGRLSGVCYALV